MGTGRHDSKLYEGFVKRTIVLFDGQSFIEHARTCFKLVMRHVQSSQAVDSNICMCSAATAIDFLQHCEIDGDLKYRNVLVSLFFCPLPVKCAELSVWN